LYRSRPQGSRWRAASSDQPSLGSHGRWWRHCHGGQALALPSGHGGHHCCGDCAATHTPGSFRPRAGSGISLSILLSVRGMRGGSHESDVHHGDETRTPRTTKNPPTWCTKCRSGFTTLPPALPYSSSLWFLVDEGLGLSSSSYGECKVDARIYMVRATGA
jgi:hypothetical protein